MHCLVSRVKSQILRGNIAVSKVSKQEKKFSNASIAINIVGDESFYKRFYEDLSLMVIYVKMEFILANEIFTNSNWEENKCKFANKKSLRKQISRNFILAKRRKLVLPEIDIDMHMADDLDYFKQKKLVEIMKSMDPKILNNYCLNHFFTDRHIMDDDETPLYGLSDTRGASQPQRNIGATSINLCSDDPWEMYCMLTFPHELAHSFGANHIGESRTPDSYLMTRTNPGKEVSIGPNNFKLAKESMIEIDSYMPNIETTFIEASRKRVGC